MLPLNGLLKARHIDRHTRLLLELRSIGEIILLAISLNI